MSKSEEKSFNCGITKIHHDNLNQVREEMQSFEELNRLSKIFKALGDLTRLKIVNALVCNELCVCDLASLFEMTQSAISHQLRVLRNLNIVNYRKEGKIVYYSINKEKMDQTLQQTLLHLLKKKETERVLLQR